MAKEVPEVSEFRPENTEKRMSAVAEASTRMFVIAGAPQRPVRQAIIRAWRPVSLVMVRFGHQPMQLSRAEDIWRQEARRIDAEEMDAIRLAEAEAERKREHEETARLVARLSRQRSAMLASDPEMYGEEAEALERTIRALGRYRESVASPLIVPPPERGGGG